MKGVISRNLKSLFECCVIAGKTTPIAESKLFILKSRTNLLSIYTVKVKCHHRRIAGRHTLVLCLTSLVATIVENSSDVVVVGNVVVEVVVVQIKLDIGMFIKFCP